MCLFQPRIAGKEGDFILESQTEAVVVICLMEEMKQLATGNAWLKQSTSVYL
jgi:hypothetical protein